MASFKLRTARDRDGIARHDRLTISFPDEQRSQQQTVETRAKAEQILTLHCFPGKFPQPKLGERECLLAHGRRAVKFSCGAAIALFAGP